MITISEPHYADLVFKAHELEKVKRERDELTRVLRAFMDATGLMWSRSKGVHKP